ncbi:hypothetical protein [Paenibacillus xylanexedens]|uniref:hypothetical protein n=1 Tax=Paenibacillus xylanexedens TaxID=528191 RepID=UPI0011A0FAF5|nr:hypothetical protein [Paenibacillus xylanexedens]
MKIQIEENLFIESDSMQFIIKEYTGKQTVGEGGKVTENYKTHGYYSDVKSCLNKIVKMKVMDSTATTLSELLEEVNGIKEYIESKVTI